MGLLAEVYTSELGALYMEDPSGLPGTTARCLRKREREMVSGLGTGTLPYTWESWKHKQERQRNENTATPRV